MIGDAGIRVIVSQTHLLSRLPATGAATVCVDDVGPAPAVDANGGAYAGPDDLAYVIYTSGSTGAPKGVMIEHRGVVNHIAALIRDYGLGPADTVLQLPSLSFHPSVRDILGTLSAGARLVVLDEAEAKDPLKIVEVIARERVTCALSFVPSLLRAVLESPRTDELPDARLRLILTCGEGLREQDARRARERFGCVVANQFGPTETIMACSKHTDGPRRPARRDGSRGEGGGQRPLYVVDRHGGLAPIGARGELLVGGLSLARGYLNRPELTAERFGADPFCAAPGARVHRTGDLVRYRGDGCLEFLGRIDDQVKIRGHRVELGEVEAALARCEGVNQAAAAAVRTDAEGECRLLGVLVPDRGGVAPEIDDVRSRLERALPAYMVPAAIAMVDELPLTPSGKVDRLALARMDADGSLRVTSGPGRARRAEGDELPAHGLEAALAEIWAGALGCDRIGRHDNFFDLGGHSLMAARVIATIERRLGKRVPLAAFFGDGVTVAGLAAAIAEPRVDSTRDGDGRLLVPVRPGGLPALFCVYPNDSSLLAARHLVPVLERDRAVFGLRPPLDGWSGGESVEERTTRFHRRRGTSTGGSIGPAASRSWPGRFSARCCASNRRGRTSSPGYSFGGIVAYELAGRLAELGHRIAFLGLVDIMTPRLWARDVKPRLRHLVTSRRRRTTAVRLVSVRRRQARVALAHVGLREPAPAEAGRVRLPGEDEAARRSVPDRRTGLPSGRLSHRGFAGSHRFAHARLGERAPRADRGGRRPRRSPHVVEGAERREVGGRGRGPRQERGAMTVGITLGCGDVHVWSATSTADDAAAEAAWKLLTADERAMARRLRDDDDRARRVQARRPAASPRRLRRRRSRGAPLLRRQRRQAGAGRSGPTGRACDSTSPTPVP